MGSSHQNSEGFGQLNQHRARKPEETRDYPVWWTELKKSVIFEKRVVVSNKKQPICEAQFSWVTRTSFVIIRSHKKVRQTHHYLTISDRNCNRSCLVRFIYLHYYRLWSFDIKVIIKYMKCTMNMAIYHIYFPFLQYIIRSNHYSLDK